MLPLLRELAAPTTAKAELVDLRRPLDHDVSCRSSPRKIPIRYLFFAIPLRICLRPQSWSSFPT